MSSRRSNLAAAFLALSLTSMAIAGPLTVARATLVEAIDLDALVKDSDDVVLARVIKQWTQYDDKRRIVTDFQMQVERVEKGKSTPGSAITVRKLGGMIGDVGMRISGEPSFSDGELVLVFGTRGQNTFLRPVGMGQGTMRIFEQDGERWVRSDSEGMTLVRHGNLGNKALSAVPSPRKLEELLSDVHDLVAKHAQQQQQAPIVQ